PRGGVARAPPGRCRPRRRPIRAGGAGGTGGRARVRGAAPAGAGPPPGRIQDPGGSALARRPGPRGRGRRQRRSGHAEEMGRRRRSRVPGGAPGLGGGGGASVRRRETPAGQRASGQEHPFRPRLPLVDLLDGDGGTGGLLAQRPGHGAVLRLEGHPGPSRAASRSAPRGPVGRGAAPGPRPGAAGRRPAVGAAVARRRVSRGDAPGLGGAHRTRPSMASTTRAVPTASFTRSPSTITYRYPAGTGPIRVNKTGGTSRTT